jgi:hypothetical protein
LQDDAPEFLEIEVLSIHEETKEVIPYQISKFKLHVLQSHIQAKVVEVKRTQYGIKAGDVLTVRYERRVTVPRVPGPTPIQRLEKARRYPAVLRKFEKEEFYHAAAEGYSFRPLVFVMPGELEKSR